MNSEYEHTCDDLLFPSAEEFQKWRASQKFRAFSLDKYEAECACITLYANALIQISHAMVHWPIRIRRSISPSPDFNVDFGGIVHVGVEHSTITSTKYQQFRADSLKHPKEQVVWLDSFKIGGPPRGEINQGWVGDEPEREWVTLAFQKAQEKLTKLNQPHFLKHARNELLLNTVSHLPNLNIEVAIRMLGEQLTKELVDGKYQNCFDAISFIYGDSTIPQALVKRDQ
jgi:hypothetical protein